MCEKERGERGEREDNRGSHAFQRHGNAWIPVPRAQPRGFQLQAGIRVPVKNRNKLAGWKLRFPSSLFMFGYRSGYPRYQMQPKETFYACGAPLIW